MQQMWDIRPGYTRSYVKPGCIFTCVCDAGTASTCSACTMSLAVGRASGIWDRQLAMTSAMAWGHSWGTLQRRQGRHHSMFK